MADPQTKTFGQLVSLQAAAVQSYASGLVDFSVGSILRAVAQSVAGLVLWLQGLILLELARTRLATSPSDEDADSFIADFFGPFADGTGGTFARLGKVGAVGDVTFSRFTATGLVFVPVGATVSTQDGTQKFTVVKDTANAAYRADLSPLTGGAYAMANGVSSVTVAAASVTLGASANVIAGTVNSITSPITGVDTVTNAADFVGGEDAESTADLILRFRRHILSLREATPTAIVTFAESMGTNVTAYNVENQDPATGAYKAGFFYDIIDDGTGTPTSDLLNAERAIIDAHRANGVEFAVIAPTVITANIAFGLTSSLVSATPDRAAAVAAVRTYVNSLRIHETLYRTRLYQVAYDASPTITDIVNLTINGGTADLAAPLPDVIKAGTVVST